MIPVLFIISVMIFLLMRASGFPLSRE